MGIRVSCPNGHVLNVKSHLAGKKGRCPSCDAVFEVPNSAAEEEVDPDAPRTAFDQIDIEQLTRESAEIQQRQVGASRSRTKENRTSAPGEGSVSVALVDEPAKSTRDANHPPDEITSDPTAVWYVRRASGDQYGPAQSMMFWQWVQEGRVPEDSHVWKQGWPEWKSAKEWLARKDLAPQRAPQLSIPAQRPAAKPTSTSAPSTAASRPALAAAPHTPMPQPLPASISTFGATATRTARRRKNNDTTAMVIIILLLMFLASLTGAIIVIYNSIR